MGLSPSLSETQGVLVRRRIPTNVETGLFNTFTRIEEIYLLSLQEYNYH